MGKVLAVQQALLVSWQHDPHKLGLVDASFLATCAPHVATAWVLHAEHGLGKEASDNHEDQSNRFGGVVQFADGAVVYMPYLSWATPLTDTMGARPAPGMMVSAAPQVWRACHWIEGSFAPGVHAAARIVAVLPLKTPVRWWEATRPILAAAGGGEQGADAAQAVPPAPPASTASPPPLPSPAQTGMPSESAPGVQTPTYGVSPLPLGNSAVSPLTLQSSLLNNSVYWTCQHSGVFCGDLAALPTPAGIPDLSTATVSVLLTSTLHDVQWEDGSISRVPGVCLGTTTTQMVSLFFPGEEVCATPGSPLATSIVPGSQGGTLRRQRGVVLSADKAAGTVRVRWLPSDSSAPQALPAPEHVCQYAKTLLAGAGARVAYLHKWREAVKRLAESGVPQAQVQEPSAALSCASDVSLGVPQPQRTPEDPLASPEEQAASRAREQLRYDCWCSRIAAPGTDHPHAAIAVSAWRGGEVGPASQTTSARAVAFSPAEVPASWGEQVGHVEDVSAVDIDDHPSLQFWARDFVTRAPGTQAVGPFPDSASLGSEDVVRVPGAELVGEVVCTDLVTGRLAVRWLNGAITLEDAAGLVKMDEDEMDSSYESDSDGSAGSFSAGDDSVVTGGASGEEESSGSDLASEDEDNDSDAHSDGLDSDGMPVLHGDEVSVATADSISLGSVDTEESDTSGVVDMMRRPGGARPSLVTDLGGYIALVRRQRAQGSFGPVFLTLAPRLPHGLVTQATAMLRAAALRPAAGPGLLGVAEDDAEVLAAWSHSMTGGMNSQQVPAAAAGAGEDEEEEEEEDLPGAPAIAGTSALLGRMTDVWRAALAGQADLAVSEAVPDGGVHVTVQGPAPGDFCVRLPDAKKSVPLQQAMKGLARPSRAWMKAVRAAHKQLASGLPQGTLAMTFADAPAVCRFLIVGPPGTPFAYVPWVFDAFLGPGFPAEPPAVHVHSFTERQASPNLYADGKVCLSLLGTWEAQEEGEGWQATSTLLQVVTSLQGLVLCDLPYFQEAGYARFRKERESGASAKLYNQNSICISLQSLLAMLNSPLQGLEGVLRAHAQAVTPRAVKVLGGLVGEPVPQASASSESAIPVTDCSEETEALRCILPQQLHGGFTASLRIFLQQLLKASESAGQASA